LRVLGTARRDAASPDRLHAATDLVAAEYSADTLLYSGPISGRGYAEVVAAVLGRSQRENCLLILTTTGGELNAAYQITRFLHQKYARLSLCAPAFCKGAGTLIVVGAHMLLIDEYSEFGSMYRELADNDAQPADTKGCLEWLPTIAVSLLDKMTSQLLSFRGGLLRTDTVVLLSAIATAALLQPITAQISLTNMAQEYRLRTLTEAYARRLSQHARNLRDGAIERLLQEYASQFIVDLAEARTLFEHVEAPSAQLADVLSLLGDQVYTQRQAAFVKMIGRPRASAAALTEQQQATQRAEQAERGPRSRRRGRAGRRRASAEH